MNIVLVTVWLAFAVGEGGTMKHMNDFKTRAACEEMIRDGAKRGFAVSCVKTEQLVPKSYYDSLP